jgi:hypothetical protein
MGTETPNSPEQPESTEQQNKRAVEVYLRAWREYTGDEQYTSKPFEQALDPETSTTEGGLMALRLGMPGFHHTKLSVREVEEPDMSDQWKRYYFIQWNVPGNPPQSPIDEYNRWQDFVMQKFEEEGLPFIENTP